MLRIKKILAPTDLKEQSIAMDHGAELVVLHVLANDPLSMSAIVPPDGEILALRGWFPIGEITPHFIDTRHRDRCRDLYNFLSQRIDPEDLQRVKVTKLVKVGDVVKGIVDIAGLRECDLIVMSSRRRGWLGRKIFGSLSEKVARKAPCPVLTIQPFAVVRQDRRRVPASSLVLREVHSRA